jgi:DNA-binding CsgD family transcriptional regulator
LSNGQGERHTDSVLASRLVARGRELTAVRETLDASRAGNGRFAFIVGEPGIGKTRLAQAAAAEAGERRMNVLRGRAVPSASPVAFRALSEALCSLVRTEGLPAEPELVPFQPALGRLVPEWRDAAGAHVDDSVVMLAEAVLRVLRVAAEPGGCLLVLEDLHWADPETLTVVEYLADNVLAEPVCCLGTLRDDEPSAALDLARSLTARRVAIAFELPRLDQDAVAEMISSCLSVSTVPDDVLALAARADGVPFLVEELLASTAASGALVHHDGSWNLAQSVEPVVPITFADSVRRRLDIVGQDTRTVLLAAAALGRSFDWKLLPAITSLPEATVLEALRAGVDAHLVASDAQDDEFHFRHALTRDAVLGQLLPPERSLLSSRTLEVIAAAHPGLPGVWCELAAELAQAANDSARAAALLLQVGRRALETGALASAESALERGRKIARADTDLMLRLGECLAEVLSLAGKRDRAFEIGGELLGLLPEGIESAGPRAETYVRMARAAVAATDWPQARMLLDRARSFAIDAADSRLLARVDALAAHTAMGAQEPERAVELARAALDHAEREGPQEVACEALEILGRCERALDLDAAAASFSRAHAIAEQHGLTIWRVRAMHQLGTIDLLADGSATRLEDARALAVSVGALATVAVLDVQIAASLTVRDDDEATISVARRAADLARRYRLEQPLAAALAFEAHAHARRSRPDEMEACLAESERHSGGDESIAMIAAFARAQLAFVDEDRAAAMRWLDKMDVRRFGTVGDQATGPYAGFWALGSVLAAPDAGTAREVVEAAGKPVHFLARAYLGHADAVTHGRAGDGEAAARLASSADAALRAFPWFRNLARRLVAESAVSEGWGDPVPWLREAMAYFDGRGNDDRIVSACRSLLRKAGAPVPRRSAGTEDVPAALRALRVTGRELEVLRLLGEGRSNRAIAERLYLSHRTVERHVANLTAKIGVDGRTELVAFAARATRDTSPA